MIRHWILELLHKTATDYMSDCGFILYGGGKGDSPDPPDYAAQAAAQGQANLDAARATAMLNNPNVINPYGTQTVTYGGGEPVFNQTAYDRAMEDYRQSLNTYNSQPTTAGSAIAGYAGGGSRGAPPVAPDPGNYYLPNGNPDIPTVTQTLSPEEQAIYDKNVIQRTNIGDVGITGSESLKDIIGQQMDFSGAPEVGNGAETRQKVYDALMSRVNEDTSNSREDANSKLVAAGIRPGTKAYDDAQNQITRGFNDARSAAEVSAGNAAAQQFGMDTQARQQYISELLSQRQTPLNEINALLSGSQVNNPFAGGLGYQGGANVQPAPIMQGANAQYGADLNASNASNAAANNTMNGLFALGSTALMFSDRRLKRNIKKIGNYLNGLAKYSFEYIWGEKSVGVMADEVEKVLPNAVYTHISGYKMVNYAMVGE